MLNKFNIAILYNQKKNCLADVILVDSRAEHILVLLLRLEDKWAVVELEDANIRGVIVVVERVKQALVGANAHANVLVDASVLPALAVRAKDSAALKDAELVVVGVRL